MKVSEQVESVLKHVPQTRNDDKLLQIVFMQKYDVNLSPKQIKAFRKMPDLWSIRRARQLIQEHGKYPASEEVDRARHDKYVEMRQNPEYVILSDNWER